MLSLIKNVQIFFTVQTFIGLMIHLVSCFRQVIITTICLTNFPAAQYAPPVCRMFPARPVHVAFADYEQQRRDLLHKYGVDLDDGNGSHDGVKTKRLDRREIDRLMGGQNGEGVFTWREKNRKKVSQAEPKDFER